MQLAIGILNIIVPILNVTCALFLLYYVWAYTKQKHLTDFWMRQCGRAQDRASSELDRAWGLIVEKQKEVVKLRLELDDSQRFFTMVMQDRDTWYEAYGRACRRLEAYER